jgi:hypothetical protein
VLLRVALVVTVVFPDGIFASEYVNASKDGFPGVDQHKMRSSACPPPYRFAHRLLSRRSTGFSLSLAMKIICKHTALADFRHNYEVNVEVSAVIVCRNLHHCCC